MREGERLMANYLSEKEIELRSNYEIECKAIERELERVEDSEPSYWELQDAIKKNNQELGKAYKKYMKKLREERVSNDEISQG
jgi:hypothetical protein